MTVEMEEAAELIEGVGVAGGGRDGLGERLGGGGGFEGWPGLAAMDSMAVGGDLNVFALWIGEIDDDGAIEGGGAAVDGEDAAFGAVDGSRFDVAAKVVEGADGGTAVGFDEVMAVEPGAEGVGADGVGDAGVVEAGGDLREGAAIGRHEGGDALGDADEDVTLNLHKNSWLGYSMGVSGIRGLRGVSLL
jgi:hypothetical protein